MIKCQMIAKNVLEVEGIHHSATNTIKRYTYYDIENWLDLSNASHSKQETPDNVARRIEPSMVEWIKKYYLPKLKEN